MEGPFTKIQGIMLARPYAPGVMEGYQEPENFPYCCPYHKEVLELAEAFFEAFPGNSEQSQQLSTVSSFNIEDYKYEGAALNIVYRLSFTEYHIAQQLNKPDWFDEITNYIDYIIGSLGQPAVAQKIYTQALAFYLENEVKVLNQDKAEALLDFILPKPEEVIEEVDLNQLFNAYQKWLAFFPFELKPFSHLKEDYINPLPFLIDNGVHNPYTHSFRVRFKTKKQLLGWLLEKTERTLAAAESGKLIKAGLILDKKSHQEDLFHEAHRIKQKALLSKFSKREAQYVKTIGEWLKNEKEYFEEYIQKHSDIVQTQPESAKTIEIKGNSFNGMPLDQVKRWFSQLATNNSSNGNPFLTPEKVQMFIDRAFLKKEELPMLTFNVAEGERTSITKLFYEYYLSCTQNYAIEPTRQCKDKYVRLLTDNFTNYNYDTVFGNFNNSKNAPMKWITSI